MKVFLTVLSLRKMELPRVEIICVVFGISDKQSERRAKTTPAVL